MHPAMYLPLIFVALQHKYTDNQTEKYRTFHAKRTPAMIVTTTPDVPARKIAEILGLVRGNSVRARHAGRDIVAALRNIVGGEIKEYAKLQAETREMATRRMVKQAEQQGADAVVNVRYESSMITTGASEILAYGTSVKLD